MSGLSLGSVSRMGVVKWPCGGVLWTCPVDGLNWCTLCDDRCGECGSERVRDA